MSECSPVSDQARIELLEQEVSKLKSKPKDNWDKAQVFIAASVPIVVAIVGYLYSTASAKNTSVTAQATLMHELIPELTSSDSKSRELAFEAIRFAMPRENSRLFISLSDSIATDLNVHIIECRAELSRLTSAKEDMKRRAFEIIDNQSGEELKERSEEALDLIADILLTHSAMVTPGYEEELKRANTKLKRLVDSDTTEPAAIAVSTLLFSRATKRRIERSVDEWNQLKAAITSFLDDTATCMTTDDWKILDSSYEKMITSFLPRIRDPEKPPKIVTMLKNDVYDNAKLLRRMRNTKGSITTSSSKNSSTNGVVFGALSISVIIGGIVFASTCGALPHSNVTHGSPLPSQKAL
jgi:hypothetical protein